MQSKNEDIKKLATALLIPNLIHSIDKGLFPPQAFTFLDSLGLIQDGNTYQPYTTAPGIKLTKVYQSKSGPKKPLKFSRAIPDRDRKDAHQLNKKYCWLNENQSVIIELKNRINQESNTRTQR